MTDEASLPVVTWLDRLSGPHGSPGGGAACAVLVAVSSALLAMVAGYSDDERVARTRKRLDEARRRALDAADEDSRRSGELGAALRGDGDDVVTAALTAAGSAVQLGDLATDLVGDLDLLLEVAQPYLVPDLVVAAEAAAAALGGTAATVTADLRLAAAHGVEPDDPQVQAATDAVKRMDAARRRIDDLRDDARRRTAD